MYLCFYLSLQSIYGDLAPLERRLIRLITCLRMLLSPCFLAHQSDRQEIALDFVLDNMEGVKDTAGFLELKQEPDLLMEIIFRQAS